MKLLDLEGEHVAIGLVINVDKDKVVMGRQIARKYLL